MSVSETNSKERAQALTEVGKYREAADVLKTAVEETNELQYRMFAAGTIVSIIVHYIHGGNLPVPGTPDHEDCLRYARLSLECFDNADLVAKSEIRDLADGLRTTLSQLEGDVTRTGAYQSSQKTGCLSSVAIGVVLCLVVTIILQYAH